MSRLTQGLTTAIQNAWLVTWLTKEPEPEVIVIDLRETYTVGPFIQLLDRLVPSAERAWRGSVLQQLSVQLTETVRRAPVKVASALLIGFLLVQTLRLTLPLQETSPTVLTPLLLAWIVALSGLRVDWTLDELAESRVGRLTKTFLEPPEPPEENDR